MTISVQPVILCRGSGPRLWPISRVGFPKQFLCLTGDESLFQQTARRLAALGSSDIAVALPYIFNGEDHRFLVLEQLRETGIPAGALLLEPIGRNTAPALTLAALAALEEGTDPVLVVTRADQTIVDQATFARGMQQAVRDVASGSIFILGISLGRPDTGYGYIQVENAIGDGQSARVVRRFVEKSDAATAQSYLNDGGYFWSAGMFVVKASVWMTALERFRPDIVQATRHAWIRRTTDGDMSARFIRPGKAEFSAIPADSVEYAVMEHCLGADFAIKMVPLAAGWYHLGVWDAVRYPGFRGHF